MTPKENRKVYYQIVDSQGSSFQDTTVDCVILSPNATVIDFRHAVLSALPRLLAGFEAPRVHVYASRNDFANNVRLEVTTIIGDSLGSIEQALIVVIPEVEKLESVQENLEQRLNRLGIKFDRADLRYLKNHDYPRYFALFSQIPRKELQDIIIEAKSKIKSTTRHQINQSMEHESIIIDGFLGGAAGQKRSSFHYAFSRSGGILVAKVYNKEYKAAFEHEVDINNRLSPHENIIKFVKSFSLPDNSRHFIIMPFLPRSAGDLLKENSGEISQIPLETIATIARDTFSALKHIHLRGFCFADLKPDNIMLESGEEGRAVLVDFGATVPIGSVTLEFTRRYCLDIDTTYGTETLDWICLATTLIDFHYCPKFTAHDTVQDMVELVTRRGDDDKHLKDIILCCLGNDSSTIEVAVNKFVDAILPKSGNR
ncbi:hypothetical protein HDU76_009218 [Blyttiomyces sp. JEL0837]|nr:hypothetical protein HDU76_009218 [Blyttiomyces sp. JEL0837]